MKKILFGLFVMLSAASSAQQDTIIGPAEVCPGSTSNLYFIPDSLNSSSVVIWSTTPGLSITSGQSTDSITVDADSLFYSGTISAQFDSITLYFNVYSTPQNYFSIYGQTFGLCITQASYYTDSVPGISYYSWSTPAGATILSGQGTTNVTIDFDSTFSSGSLSVTITNACSGTSTQYLSLNAAPQSATFIYGPTEELCAAGTSTASYTVAPVSGATSYTWFSPSGVTITSGQGTDSITVSVDSTFTSGILAVYVNNACGTSDSTQLFLNSIPEVYAISGPTTELCPNGNSYVNYYAYSNSPAASYNWTAPYGATIVAGQGTNNVLVSFDSTFATGIISVIPVNACGSGAQIDLALTSQPQQPGSISGPTDSLCTNVVYTYQLDSAFNSTFTTYSWSVPPGTYIISGQGTVQIDVYFDGTSTGGTIEVYSFNNCGTSEPSTLTIGTPTPFMGPGQINGPNTGICSTGSTTATYYLDSTLAGITHNWTVPSGMTILSGQGTDSITISVDSTFLTGTISVVNVGDCGTSPPSTLTINSFLGNSYAISGQDYYLCNISTPLLYFAAPLPGATTYTWTLPAGATIVSGQGNDSIYVSYDSTFTSGIMSVVPSANCNYSNPTQLFVSAAPITPQGGIVGPHNSMCGLTSAQYFIYNSAPAPDSYTWYVPTGLTILSGQGTDTINVSIDTTTFTGGILSATANNACGSSSPSELVLQFSATHYFNGPYDNLCNYYNTTTTYVLSGDDITSWFWNVPSGFTIVSGQGTEYLTVFIDSSFTNGPITIDITTQCGFSGTSEVFLEAIPAAPDSIAGPRMVCPDVTDSYNIANSGGVGTYTWVVPGGMNIISGQGTWFIDVSYDPGFTGGTMYVYKTNDCGAGAVATIVIGIYPTLPAPTPISGPGVGLCPAGMSTASYSVPPVTGAVIYNWGVPGGVTILDGYGTDSIYVSFDSTFTSGNLDVTVTNACNVQSAVTSLLLRSVTAKPGAVTGSSSVCDNETGLTYSISTVSGATGYVWSVPSGATIVSGQGTTSITVDWGTSNGNVTVIATNDCGNSQTRIKHVSSHGCHSPVMLGVTENGSVAEVNIYPNPNNGTFTLNVTGVSSEQSEVRISNLLGEVIYTGKLSVVNGRSIDLSDHGKGIYLVQVIGEGTPILRKVVIQ